MSAVGCPELQLSMVRACPEQSSTHLVYLSRCGKCQAVRPALSSIAPPAWHVHNLHLWDYPTLATILIFELKMVGPQASSAFSQVSCMSGWPAGSDMCHKYVAACANWGIACNNLCKDASQGLCDPPTVLSPPLPQGLLRPVKRQAKPGFIICWCPGVMEADCHGNLPSTATTMWGNKPA